MGDTLSILDGIRSVVEMLGTQLHITIRYLSNIGPQPKFVVIFKMKSYRFEIEIYNIIYFNKIASYIL